MKLAVEFLKLMFYATASILVFAVIVGLGTEIVKNIKISSKIKDNDVCLYINNELYCRLDYNISFEYKTNKA